MEGQARGTFEILSKRAEGLARIVAAAGMQPRDAALLMVAEKLPEIAQIQVEAVKGIKIDKVIVWDNLGGAGGTPKTAQFLSGILNALPAWDQLFKSVWFNLGDLVRQSTAEAEDGQTERLKRAQSPQPTPDDVTPAERQP